MQVKINPLISWAWFGFLLTIDRYGRWRPGPQAAAGRLTGSVDDTE